MKTKTPSLQDTAAEVSGYDPDALPVAHAQEFMTRAALRPVDVELRVSLGAAGNPEQVLPRVDFVATAGELRRSLA